MRSPQSGLTIKSMNSFSNPFRLYLSVALINLLFKVLIGTYITPLFSLI